MNDLVTKDFYKADVFRFDLEKQNDTIELVISNTISWDCERFRFTRNELKGLANFINQFLES